MNKRVAANHTACPPAEIKSNSITVWPPMGISPSLLNNPLHYLLEPITFPDLVGTI